MTREPTMLDRLREARQARDEAQETSQQEFAEQVRDAMRHRNGHQVKEIAKAAGLSRERVYQLARGER